MRLFFFSKLLLFKLSLAYTTPSTLRHQGAPAKSGFGPFCSFGRRRWLSRRFCCNLTEVEPERICVHLSCGNGVWVSRKSGGYP